MLDTHGSIIQVRRSYGSEMIIDHHDLGMDIDSRSSRWGAVGENIPNWPYLSASSRCLRARIRKTPMVESSSQSEHLLGNTMTISGPSAFSSCRDKALTTEEEVRY